MPNRSPPSLIWTSQVDPPLQQDGAYRLNATDRAYIDDQIRGVETLLLATAAKLPSILGPLTPPANGSWSQTAWYIDPIHGNDASAGTAPTAALKTKRQLIQLWGTTRPVLTSTVTITYLSSETNDSDPGIFEPILVGGQLIHMAALPTATLTATLNTVTAKNRSSNQILQATFSVTSGAVAAGMMLVNSTRSNSRAFAQRNTSGSTWQISQPMAPYAGTGATYAPSEVDTWAAGDTIHGYALTSVNLVRIGGALVDYDSTAGPGHIAYQLTLLDAGQFPGVGNLDFHNRAMPAIVECTIQRVLHVQGPAYQYQNASQPGVFNCASTANNNNLAGGNVTFYAGFLTGLACPSGVPTLGYDLIVRLASSLSFFDAGFVVNGNGLALDAGSIPFELTGANGLTEAPIYGPGKVNVQSGQLQLTSTATSLLPVGNTGAGGGGLELAGVPTGYSMATSGGVTTIHGGIALTPASIDATAGASGFGGTATNLAGASITNGGAQP